MTSSQRHHRTATRSQRWLGALAFLVLLVVGGGGLTLWRLQSVGLQAVHDNRMAPLIQRQDAVVIKPMNRVQAGDIISYHDPINPAAIITSRVLSVDNTQGNVITRGDSATQSSASAPFSQELVIGKVQYHILKFGYALDFLRSPAGLLAGVYLPALIVISLELRRLSRHYALASYRLLSYKSLSRLASRR